MKRNSRIAVWVCVYLALAGIIAANMIRGHRENARRIKLNQDHNSTMNLQRESALASMRDSLQRNDLPAFRASIDKLLSLRSSRDVEFAMEESARLGRTDFLSYCYIRGFKNPAAATDYLSEDLLAAVSYPNTSTVAFLLAHGANVHGLRASQSTPMQRIAGTPPGAKDAVPVARLIIQYGGGADLPAVSHALWLDTPLASTYRTQAAETPATRNAPRSDIFGNTPLMLAAHAGNIEMVKLLLSYHADPNRRNPRGQTAADIAQHHGHASLARLLRQAQHHS